MTTEFTRLEDGSVKLIMRAFGDWYTAVYDAEEWAGIVAAVSKYGATAGNAMFAAQLHQGNIHEVHFLK